MKNLTKFRACFCVALLSGAIAFAPANAQEEDAAQTPTVDENPQWKQLADQIIQLQGNQSLEGRDLNEAQQAAYDRIIDLYTELNKLSTEQTVPAHRYMMVKSSNLELRRGEATNLIAEEPTAENVKFVLPYFEKFTDKQKNAFLEGLIFDAVLLRPNVPEFRQFPDSILKQAAEGAKLPADLVSEAAVIVANYTTAEEKQWMHQALAHYSESTGLWSTLTQLNALTPAEVAKARQMFAAKQSQSGWKLVLAAALSPYDPGMRELVRQTVATQISTYEKGEVLPQPLMILRVWETKQALPYLLKMLNAANEEMRLAAIPLLALRAPQELLRIAKLPGAGDKIVHLGAGLALMALKYPQLKTQAAQTMVKLQGLEIFPEDDPQEVFDETYTSNLGELQATGMVLFSSTV